MKTLLKITAFLIAVVFLFYLLLPAPPFPEPPPDSPQSHEPGDTEDVNTRRSYFTDFSRDKVLEYYQNQWNKLKLGPLEIPVPTYRLSYPPEDAYTLIRDQTRSTHLEEIVHPLRESFFVNEFVPKSEKDTILINNKKYYQKITVRYVRSSPLSRVSLAIVSIGLLMFLLREWHDALRIKKSTL